MQVRLSPRYLRSNNKHKLKTKARDERTRGCWMGFSFGQWSLALEMRRVALVNGVVPVSEQEARARDDGPKSGPRLAPSAPVVY